MPGGLIIEDKAQAGFNLVLKAPRFVGKTGYLGDINNAKFRQVVRPGDVLKLHITMAKQRDNMGIVNCYASVDDKKVCEADLTFIVAAADKKL